MTEMLWVLLGVLIGYVAHVWVVNSKKPPEEKKP